MKLSNDTLSVLKNFGSINQGLLFKQGKTLKTVSSLKNILAEATINEEIPTEFGVYDLNNFLSVVSLHKDDPSFEFSDNNVVIVGNGGRSKILYRFCAGNLINTPPEKALTMPEPEVSFSLSAEDLELLRPRNIGELPVIDYSATLQDLEASNPEQLPGDYLENSADLFARFRKISE